MLELRLALEHALDELGQGDPWRESIVKQSFEREYLPQGLTADRFREFVPIGISRDSLRQLELDGKYSPLDTFWGKPVNDADLPGVYTDIYDDAGERVTSVSAGKRRPFIFRESRAGRGAH